MANDIRIGLIVAAAGRSTRFGSGDKLAQDLGERPLLVRAIEPFTKHDAFGAIVVAGPADPDEFAAFRERFGPTLAFHGASVVPGGATERWETVQRAIEHVPEDCTHIAIHDAARPAVSNDLLDRLAEACASVDAVVPGLPVSDTLKRVAADPVDVSGAQDALARSILGDEERPSVEARPILETVERGDLYAVQTPQVFRAELLRRAYCQTDLDGITDDAGVVERLGETVYVIEGDPTNIKITRPGDLRLVRAILGLRPPRDRPTHLRF